jgi:hypothetical protein
VCKTNERVVYSHWYMCTHIDGARLNNNIFDWPSRKGTGACIHWKLRKGYSNIGVEWDVRTVSKWLFCNEVGSKCMNEYVDG